MTTAAATAETAAKTAAPPPQKAGEESRIRVVKGAGLPSPLAGEGRGEGSSEKAAPEAAKPAALDPAKAAEIEAANLKLLGQVTWLLGLSPPHRHMFIADLEWRIRPAIVLRQCRLFHDKGRAVAFVTWAYVSDEVAGRLKAAPDRLRPDEWRCGNRLTIMDVVAPFGGGEKFVQEVVDGHAKAAQAAATQTAAGQTAAAAQQPASPAAAGN